MIDWVRFPYNKIYCASRTRRIYISRKYNWWPIKNPQEKRYYSNIYGIVGRSIFVQLKTDRMQWPNLEINRSQKDFRIQWWQPWKYIDPWIYRPALWFDEGRWLWCNWGVRLKIRLSHHTADFPTNSQIGLQSITDQQPPSHRTQIHHQEGRRKADCSSHGETALHPHPPPPRVQGPPHWWCWPTKRRL